MKKKLMVALAAVMAACALTACGNPLKSLPEVGSDNLVDLVDENEDKNQAAAAILKKLLYTTEKMMRTARKSLMSMYRSHLSQTWLHIQHTMCLQ